MSAAFDDMMTKNQEILIKLRDYMADFAAFALTPLPRRDEDLARWLVDWIGQSEDRAAAIYGAMIVVGSLLAMDRMQQEAPA